MTLRMSERRTSMLGALLATLGPISMSIYTPAMPELVTAFSSTESMIKLTLSVYFGGFSIAQLLSGPMSDAFGRKPATLAFVGINLLGSLICLFAPSVEWLLAGRLIQGIGASVGITVARAIVRDQFVGAEASRIMNLIGIMLAIGPAMAPTIGGLALAAFGWHSIFVFLIGFGLLVLSGVTLFMRETTVADRALARPARLLSAYGSLLADRRFIAAALVLGGSVGALYAQATMLPFILIERVGLTPTAFGIGMLHEQPGCATRFDSDERDQGPAELRHDLLEPGGVVLIHRPHGRRCSGRINSGLFGILPAPPGLRRACAAVQPGSP